MSTWERFKFACYIFWYGESGYVKSRFEVMHERLMGDPLTGYVRLAFEKLRDEPVYPGRPRIYDMPSGASKHREVVSWARKYAREGGLEDPSEWHINYIIELCVGEEKGRL